MYTIYVGVGGGVIQLGNYGKSSTFGHPECPPLIIIELVSNTSWRFQIYYQRYEDLPISFRGPSVMLLISSYNKNHPITDDYE